MEVEREAEEGEDSDTVPAEAFCSGDISTAGGEVK